jgi:hypothetical protein
MQYLAMARQLDGYSSVCFPQCQFEVPEADASEDGLAQLAVDFNGIQLKVQRDEDSLKV